MSVEEDIAQAAGLIDNSDIEDMENLCIQAYSVTAHLPNDLKQVLETVCNKYICQNLTVNREQKLVLDNSYEWSEWIGNTGASIHVTNNIEDFIEYEPITPILVTTAKKLQGGMYAIEQGAVSGLRFKP